MKLVKTSDTILQLRKKYYLWKQFIAETRDRGIITAAVDCLISGKGDKLMTYTLTAFDIAEPEAQAWLSYFRQIGAIATSEDFSIEGVSDGEPF